MATVAGRDLDALFRALDAELRRLGVTRAEICVIGGSALNAIGLASRPTRDIDVVAIGSRQGTALVLAKSRPLPEPIRIAAAAVASQFNIEPDWLNAGPADLIDHGLPEGFETRLVSADYGDSLVIHFAGRLDQICFKTFAAADSAGRHLADLLALSPSENELQFAAQWIATQDTLEGFGSQLERLLDYLGMPCAVVEL